jgi:hypothetical protein
MNPTQYEVQMIEELNATKLTYKEIAKLVRACAKYHVEGGDNSDLVVCKSVEVFAKNPAKAKAAYFRLFALARLMKQDDLKGWTMSGE